MRALIADDTMVMRMMLTHCVEEMRFIPIVAQDGAEALELAFCDGFDIAILDWEMPKLTGMEVIRPLKEHPRTSYGHLILVTGRDDQSSLIQALNGGADDFIRKPLAPAELVARLRAGARIVEMRNRIIRLAETDPLTGAINRRCFLELTFLHEVTDALPALLVDRNRRTSGPDCARLSAVPLPRVRAPVQ